MITALITAYNSTHPGMRSELPIILSKQIKAQRLQARQWAAVPVPPRPSKIAVTRGDMSDRAQNRYSVISSHPLPPTATVSARQQQGCGPVQGGPSHTWTWTPRTTSTATRRQEAEGHRGQPAASLLGHGSQRRGTTQDPKGQSPRPKLPCQSPGIMQPSEEPCFTRHQLLTS